MGLGGDSIQSEGRHGYFIPAEKRLLTSRQFSAVRCSGQDAKKRAQKMFYQ